MFAPDTPSILRPPCAAPEKEFLARCIHCGQCAQVCPHGSIVMRSGFEHLVDYARHTPEIFPESKPCYLCMKCPPVCPSGALTTDIMDLAQRAAMAEIMQDEEGRASSKSNEDKAKADRVLMAKATAAANIAAMSEANMGQAYILQDRCHNHTGGIMCWTCYDRCPLRGKAIVLAGGFTPAVTEACVGCGICEYVCPVMASGALEKAIFVVPKGAPQPSGTIDTLPPPVLKPTTPVSPNVSEMGRPDHGVHGASLYARDYDSNDDIMVNSIENSMQEFHSISSTMQKA
ncbi:MAG: 4Fe-4S dicluster domain-containing protein [Pseudomonadota bacterium]